MEGKESSKGMLTATDKHTFQLRSNVFFFFFISKYEIDANDRQQSKGVMTIMIYWVRLAFLNVLKLMSEFECLQMYLFIYGSPTPIDQSCFGSRLVDCASRVIFADKSAIFHVAGEMMRNGISSVSQHGLLNI